MSLHDSWMVTEAGLAADAEPIVPGEGLGLLDTLGEGGSSVVRLGVQNALGREVAVKSMRPDRANAGLEQLLLREAWVTGALEHPNIVPIYDIVRDADDKPLIVLRRISGRSWGDLLWDPDALEAAAGAMDPLEWSLRVLLRVCDAVRFAHDRGFLHRDLKPDNVMVGDFGEVYVVDWGLALRLDPDGDPRIPAADGDHPLAGTPAYMAPEMLGEGEPLTAQTDVFLLGAILFEVMTGAPPWCQEVDDALFDRIRQCELVLPPEAPPRLGAICQRAMRREPASRHPTVAALREDIEAYLQRRGADAMALEAQGHLADLEALIGQGARRRAIYTLQGQCRFGFQQALAAWPDHEGAAAGLRRARELLIHYELDRGDLETAEAVLGELDSPSEALMAEVELLRAQKGAERERIAALEANEREQDPRIEQRARVRLIGGLGLSWTLLPWTGVWMEPRYGPPGHLTLLAIDVFFLATAAGLAWRSREKALATAFNRNSVGAVLLVLVVQLPMNLGAWMLGLDTRTIMALHMPLWTITAGLIALVVTPGFLPAALGFGFTFLMASARPELLYPSISLACLIFTLNVVALWER